MRWLFPAFFAAFAISICLGGCGGGGSQPCCSTHQSQTAPNPIPSEIVLSITTQNNATSSSINPVNHDPLVSVTIGNSTVPVVLDTGSSGLRVFALALQPQDYTATNTSINATFGSFGSSTQYTYQGSLATADIKIGGTDLGTQAFQVVTSISGDASFQSEMKYKGMGVFGVAPTPPDNVGIGSLMGAFPGNLSSGFIISLSSSQMQIGISDADRSTFGQLYGVPTSSVPSGGTPPYWQTSTFTWCYTLTIPGLTSVSNACVANTLTDTGGLNAHLYFTNLSPPMPLPASTSTAIPTNTLVTLPPQTTVSAVLVTQPGAPVFTWNAPPTGTCSGYDMVNVWFGSGGGRNSNGINPYFTNDVLYDLAKSQFGFRAAASSLPSFCAPGT
ncbi:MAG: DUF3443 family protein [Vulcanimicrobiaceae bacterium]|jgi:hypothetical protein